MAQRKCGAKTRRGTKCQAPAMPNGRCRVHGGPSLSGPAHPAWKDGRHSKYLPKDLVARYREGTNDPQLIELRDEVALIDMRVSQLLEAIGQTGSTRLWKDARTAFDAFKSAGGKGKGAVGAARVALQQLDDLLVAGLTAAVTWDELRDTIDLRRKLSESETKRLKDLQQMIPVERALSLLIMLVEEVTKRVTDREVLAAVSAQFLRITGGGSRETSIP